jgi:hypothetical protein
MLAAMTSKGEVAGQHQKNAAWCAFMLVLRGYEENSRSNNRFLDQDSSIVLFGSNCEPLSQIVPACA